MRLLASEIRVCIVFGFWAGAGFMQLAGPTATYVGAATATVAAGGLLFRDVRRAWREHLSMREGGS